MRTAAGWLALLGALCAGPSHAGAPRVASINLCTDALLLELAEPAQIASLTHLARDAALSPYPELARQYPSNHGQAEEILQLHPDLVLAGAGSGLSTQALLRQLGLKVVTIPAPTSLASIIDTLLSVGRQIDQPARAATLAGKLAALPSEATMSTPPATAMIVQAGGYVPGPETLGPALLQLAGLRDIAPALGLGNGGFVPLESLLIAKPGWIVSGRASRAGRALADDFNSHPALWAAQRRTGAFRIAQVDDADWACGSSSFADAVRELREAVAHP